MEKTTKTTVVKENLISVTNLSRSLGVSRRTIYNWINEGKIKQVDFLNKKWVDKSTMVNSIKKNDVTKVNFTTQDGSHIENGIFHQWGYEVIEVNGAHTIQYTIGICEDSNGNVHSINPEKIQFER